MRFDRKGNVGDHGLEVARDGFEVLGGRVPVDFEVDHGFPVVSVAVPGFGRACGTIEGAQVPVLTAAGFEHAAVHQVDPHVPTIESESQGVHEEGHVTDEDRDEDGNHDVEDCYPHEVRNLLIEFDSGIYIPVLEDANGKPNRPGQVVIDLNKSIMLRDVFASGRAFVRVEVTSPLSAKPLKAGEIAVLRFKLSSSAPQAVDFAPFGRLDKEELLTKDLTTTAPPVSVKIEPEKPPV